MKISNPDLISRRLQFSFSKVHEKEVKDLTSANISFIMNEVLRVKSEVEIKANRKLSISELMAFISINALMAGQPAQCVDHSISSNDNDNDIGTGQNEEDAGTSGDIQVSSNTKMQPSDKDSRDNQTQTQTEIALQHETSEGGSTAQEEADEAHLVDAGSLFGGQGVSAMFDFSKN